MKHIRVVVGLVSVLWAAVLFAVVPRAYAGFGVSPLFTVVDQLLAGARVERTVYFVRGDASQPATLLLKVEGDAAEALTGIPETMEVPVGMQQIPVTFGINAGTLPKGDYAATITALLQSAEQTQEENSASKALVGATVFVRLGAVAQVRFSVSNDQTKKFHLRDVLLRSSETKQPLGFSFRMTNEGNVDAAPTRIEITITDVMDPTQSYTTTIHAASIKRVKAFEDGEVSLFANLDLTPGKYWVNMVFYDGDEAIFTNEKAFLQIFPEGTLAQKGEMVAFTADKQKYEVGELGLLRAQFKNTGEIGLSAALTVELSKNGKRMELLKTEPSYVPPERSTVFTLERRFEEAGDYTAVGSVSYGINATEPVSIEFRVGGIHPLVLAGVFVALSALIAASIIFWRKRRRPLNDSVDNSISETPPENI